jgi:hypothetical protein
MNPERSLFFTCRWRVPRGTPLTTSRCFPRGWEKDDEKGDAWCFGLFRSAFFLISDAGYTKEMSDHG